MFKKLIFLNYKKTILPLQILKNPKKILVLLPIETYELSSFVPALKLLRESFKSSKLIGVVREEDALFFKSTGLLDQIIGYQSTPFFLSRQFFRIKRKLRENKAEISIDFNLHSDLLSWIGAAHLRIGTQDSPFINYKVKLSEKDVAKRAIKIINSICTGR